MLPHSARLHNTSDFNRVYATGTRHYSSGVLLFWLPNTLQHTRIACVVSKKTHPSAATRNRQRRILQAACRALYPILHPSMDIIVIYTNRADVLPYKEAVKTLTLLCRRANLLLH